MNQPFSIGQRVRPAGDGEDQSGRILKWTRLQGTVVDIWMTDENTSDTQWRVEVKWDDSLANKQYGTRMDSYLLTAIN